MDDDQVGQVSDLSDWDEPASQPDLSTNDSTFVPPANTSYKLSSTRKVLVEGALDSGMPETMVGKLAGQRSNEAKASYVEKKDVTTRAATIAVSRAGAGLKANYQEILEKVQAQDDEEIEAIRRSSKEGVKGAGSRELNWPTPFAHQQPTTFGHQQPSPFYQQQRPTMTGYLG